MIQNSPFSRPVTKSSSKLLNTSCDITAGEGSSKRQEPKVFRWFAWEHSGGNSAFLEICWTNVCFLCVFLIFGFYGNLWGIFLVDLLRLFFENRVSWFNPSTKKSRKKTEIILSKDFSFSPCSSRHKGPTLTPFEPPH